MLFIKGIPLISYCCQGCQNGPRSPNSLSPNREEVYSRLKELSGMVSIGSRSLNRCKKAGLKFYDLFLLIEWAERSLVIFLSFYL